jgi:hypothetical protein
MLHLLTSALARLRRRPRLERRVWARLLTNQETVCRLKTDDVVVCLRALVTNVSRAGAQLLLTRPLTCHTLLSLELPGALGRPSHAVLARVVHALPRTEGLWDVGCSFAAELSEEELQAFGVKEPSSLTGDRRAQVRRPCALMVTFRPTESPDSAEVIGKAIDISPVGVGLLVRQPVEVGTLLNLELLGEGGQSPLKIRAGVVRTAGPVAGKWTVGCHFVRELTAGELQALPC